MNKITTLVPLSEFVLNRYEERTNKHPSHDWMLNDEDARLFVSYAEFLTKPLELGFFVPCDDENNVLEEPESLKGYYETHHEGMQTEKELVKEYQQAKEKVLFEGFIYYKKGQPYSENYQVDESWCNARKIEDVITLIGNVTLSEQALKQIYG